MLCAVDGSAPPLTITGAQSSLGLQQLALLFGGLIGYSPNYGDAEHIMQSVRDELAIITSLVHLVQCGYSFSSNRNVSCL